MSLTLENQESEQPENETVEDFLKGKIEEFKIKRGLKTMAEVAAALDVSESTIYNHLREERGYISRTVARFWEPLGLTEADMSHMRLLGLKPAERENVRENIELAIDLLQEPHPRVIAQNDIIPLLDAPIKRKYGTNLLAPIIDEVLDERGLRPTRTHLLEEILRQDRELQRIHDPEVEKQLRNQEIGKLFEEIALLNYQIKEKFNVPQYCLTPQRNKSGRVVSTKDIADFVVQRNSDMDVLDKALFDHGVKKGDFKVVDSGKYLVKLRNLGKGKVERRAHYFDADGKVTKTEVDIFSGDQAEITRFNDGLNVLRAKEPLRYVTYQDEKTGSKYVMHEPNPGKGSFLKEINRVFGGGSRAPTIDWEPAHPFRVVEVKKAGSQSRESALSVKEQLDAQKKAILRHREKGKSNIPALVSGIDVLVLTPNPELRKVLEGDDFFRYHESGEFGSEFGEFVGSLKKGAYTYEEVIALKRFFGRVNYELNQQPTLVSFSDIYSAFLDDKRSLAVKPRKKELERMMRRHRGISVESLQKLMKSIDPLRESLGRGGLIETLDRIVSKIDRDKENREKLETFKKKAEIVASLMSDLYVKLGPGISDDMLAQIFEEHFKRSYDERGSLNSSMMVYEEQDGKLVRYPRRFASSRASKDLIERVAEITRKRVYDGVTPNIEDEASLRLFLDLQKQKIEDRKARRQSHDDREKKFGLGLLACRFQQYDGESRMRFSERFGSYTYTNSGLIGQLRYGLSGETDNKKIKDQVEKNLTEQLIFGMVSAALNNGGANQALLEETFGASPMLKRAVSSLMECQSRQQFLQDPKLAEELAKLYVDIITRLPQAKKEDFMNWRAKIHEIGRTSESALSTPGPSLNIEERGTLTSRRSIDFHVSPELVSSFSATDAFSPLYRLIDQLNNVDSSQGIHLENQDFSPDHVKGLMQRPAFKEAMSGFFNTKPGQDILRRMQGKLPNLYGAVLTRVGNVEEKILYEFGKRVLDNSLALGEISHDVAKDYLSANLEGLVTAPEIYTDVYLMQLRDTLDRLHDPKTFEALRQYVEKDASNGELRKREGELLRRTVVMGLRSKGEKDKFFVALNDGKYDDAAAIESANTQPTAQAITSVYKKQMADPHVRHLIRSSGVYKRSTPQTVDGDLANNVFSEEKELTLALDKLREMKYKDAKPLDEREEQQLREHTRTLLYAFKSLPIEMQENSRAGMFNPRIYRGRREYNKTTAAISFISQKAPWAMDDYIFEPEKVLLQTGYLTQEQINLHTNATQ